MKLTNNRFAIFPKMCTDCQKYIWLETYRHGDRWEKFADRYLKVNICKECAKKYLFGRGKSDENSN